jgi:hypothetical protein
VTSCAAGGHVRRMAALAARRCTVTCGLWCYGSLGKMSHGATGGSTTSLPGGASQSRRPRSGRSCREGEVEQFQAADGLKAGCRVKPERGAVIGLGLH